MSNQIFFTLAGATLIFTVETETEEAEPFESGLEAITVSSFFCLLYHYQKTVLLSCELVILPFSFVLVGFSILTLFNHCLNCKHLFTRVNPLVLCLCKPCCNMCHRVLPK